MKLLTFIGLCLVLHLALAQVGKEKVPPFRHPKDDKLDGVINADRVIHKREIGDRFLPGKEKVPPFRPVNDGTVDLSAGGEKVVEKRAIGDHKEKIPPFRPPKDEKTDEIFEKREKRQVHDKIPPIVNEEGDKVNGQVAEHLNNKDKREVAVDEQQGQSLPLLLKTLRLRPGSEDYQRIVEEFVNSQNVGEQPELPGKHLIGKNRHPREADKQVDLPLLLKTLRLRPGSEDYQRIINDFVASRKDQGGVKESDLPLLLKTLRLRPGSDDYQRIIDDYVNAQNNGGEQPELPGHHLIGKERHPRSVDEPQEENSEEPRLLGKNLIGKNRHPKGERRDKRGADKEVDLPLLMKTLRLRPGSEDYQRIVDDFVASRKGQGGVKESDLPLLLKTLRLRPGSDDYQRIIDDYVNAQNKEGDLPLPGEHLIGSHRRPKHHEEDDNTNNKDKRESTANENDLPLLLKTHRLRPGSNQDYHDIIQNFINSRKGNHEKPATSIDDEPRLLGEPLIGKNRHPKGDREPRDIDVDVGPLDVSIETDDLVKRDLLGNRLKDRYDLVITKRSQPDVVDDEDLDDVEPLGLGLIGKFRRPPVLEEDEKRLEKSKSGKVECSKEDQKQVLKCFNAYFNNFGLEVVDGKLPSMFEIFIKMSKFRDYETKQKHFQDFQGCYKSTPEACYHADELCKIAHKGEADYIASFFTAAEFAYQSKHHKKVLKCFSKQMAKSFFDLSLIGMPECSALEKVLNKSIQKFGENCAKLDPKEGELKQFLVPFFKRTSIGESCPRLLEALNL